MVTSADRVVGIADAFVGGIRFGPLVNVDRFDTVGVFPDGTAMTFQMGFYECRIHFGQIADGF